MQAFSNHPISAHHLLHAHLPSLTAPRAWLFPHRPPFCQGRALEYHSCQPILWLEPPDRPASTLSRTRLHVVAIPGLVGQQGLLPKPSDPRLWLLEVRPGLERQLVVSLLQRAIHEPLLIKSAFCQDHLSVRSPPCHSRARLRTCMRCMPLVLRMRMRSPRHGACVTAGPSAKLSAQAHGK